MKHLQGSVVIYVFLVSAQPDQGGAGTGVLYFAACSHYPANQESQHALLSVVPGTLEEVTNCLLLLANSSCATTLLIGT